MLYRVQHVTTYHYSDPVSLCQNLAHLTPRNSAFQECFETDLSILPEPAVMSIQQDYFGNPATFFSIQEPHTTLRVVARHVVELTPRADFASLASPAWEAVVDELANHGDEEVLLAYAFVFDSPYIQTSEELADFARPCFPEGRPLLEAVLELTKRIHRDFEYDPKATTVTTPLREMFVNRRGVCQDFAHLQIGCLRSLGLAARYVSGYMCTEPPPGQPRLIGADASHAWLSVYCPNLGWIDFDPTNGVMPSDKHILVAWGRDYDDVSPIKGVILGGGEHKVTVGVDVIPTSEMRSSELGVRS
jgi:transglutaminase-like putative cysteine protease